MVFLSGGTDKDRKEIGNAGRESDSAKRERSDQSRTEKGNTSMQRARAVGKLEIQSYSPPLL
jgi:hypothetical protein